MPNSLTPAYAASTFSSTCTASVNFGGNPDRALFGVIFFDNNVDPNTANVTSVVVDPGGANIACTLGARRAGSTTLGVGGIFYSFTAVGMPTGTVNVVATCDVGTGRPSMICLPLDDVISVSVEQASTALSLSPSVTVPSAADQTVFGILAMFISDAQTVAASSPATQLVRILEANAGGLCGAIWQEAGAASVVLDGTITSPTPRWALTAISASGPGVGSGAITTLDGALNTVTGEIASVPLTPTSTLTGALNGITGAVSAGAVQGILMSALPLRDAARQVLANRSDVAVHVQTLATLATVQLFAGQSIVSGIWTGAGPFLPGQPYAVTYGVGGTRIGCEIITAVAM